MTYFLPRLGKYPPPPGESTVLGLEMAGVIEEVGEGVTSFKAGDRVWYGLGSPLTAKMFPEHMCDRMVCIPCVSSVSCQCAAWWRRLCRVLRYPPGHRHARTHLRPHTLRNVGLTPMTCCFLQIPENLSFEEAAAIPEAFLTAYQALVWVGGLAANKRLLIHAGVRLPSSSPLPAALCFMV